MVNSADGHKKTIVVVGAGIVGIGTSIWLARDGHHVTLVDAEGPAAGTSYGNAGILANSSIVPVQTPGLLAKAPGMLFGRDGPLFLKWSYLLRLLPWLRRYLSYCTVEQVEAISAALMPIIGDSVDQHLAIARGTPAEHFIAPVDYTYAYANRDAYLKDALAWRIRRDHGFTTTEIEEPALRELEPSLGPDTRFAIRLPGHAWIRDPGGYVTALCDYAQTLGVELRIARVLDFVRSGERVTGVHTSDGEIRCDEVVVASGVWSKALLEKLAVSVPMESERGYHLELVNPENGPGMPIALAAHKFIATPMDGRLRLAGLVEFGGLDAPPSDAPYELLLRQVRRAFPRLRWSEEKRWLGHRPATVDSVPVIGPVIPGVYAAFGHQHVGLTGGPKTGRIIADLIADRTPNFDMTPYRVDRF
jgi:D-amino-acid dehydrogenase